jgi:hypothetical protein
MDAGKEFFMKNFIVLGSALAILTICFGGCEQPTDEQNLPQMKFL